MHNKLDIIGYARQVGIFLDNLILSYGTHWTELKTCKDDLQVLVLDELAKTEGNLTEDSARKMKSVFDRIKGALGEVNQGIERMF